MPTLVLSYISCRYVFSVDDVAHLRIASALLGLAYGSAFSLFPTVCLKWFGVSVRLLPFLFFKYLLNAIYTSLSTWVYISLSHIWGW